MKKIFTVCLIALLAAFGVDAQTPPAYYVDSQSVNFTKVYLNPDNIQQITVRKAPLGDMTASGSIYLTLKKPFTSFLTLSAITSGQALPPAKNIIYVIDDKLIKDTSGIRIDPSLVLSVSTFDMSDVHYIGAAATKMGMIIIRTKNKGKEDEKGAIRLRGAATGADNKIPPENQGE